MKERIQTSTLMFYGVTALMAVICIVCIASAASWLNRPFAGFLVYKDTSVSVSGSRNWPGPKAGLKFRERIVAVDGRPIADGRDLVKMLEEKEPGMPVQYSAESKGKTHEIIVSVAEFGLQDFALVFVIPFLIGFIIYVLGFVVYVLKPNTSTSWVFLACCFCLGTMILAGFENQTSYFVSPLFYAINALWPFTFFHLFLIFPERRRILNRLPALEYLLYLPALIIIVGFEVYFSIFRETLNSGAFAWFPTYRELGRINGLLRLLCIAGILFILLYAVIKPLTIQERQRAKVIFWGMAIAFGPPVVVMTLFFFVKVNVPWNLLAFFVIFFPASIAYSIVRHNLFDADAIIKRTVGYVVVTAIVVGAYAIVSVTLNVFLGQYQVAQSRAFPILFTLAVIFVFNPLRDRIQSLVDRLFFRKEYNYGEIVEKVGNAMTTLLDLPQVIKRLVTTFTEDMFINTSSVMLLTPEGTEYRVYLSEGENKENVEDVNIDRKTPLMEIIEKEKTEITKYDVLEDPKYKAVSEACALNFKALNASLMIPLVYQDNVIGLLNLGEKKSGKFFSREDVDLARTLATQGAMAIENARMVKEVIEKERMEEELNIARDLQVSMLPSGCPQIKGFEIAAYSLAAREVGGDFYDFIDMGEDKAGMVIGDVTGKSVSGALVMSASRSVFRMLSEEERTVRESMMRANRRIKKDVKPGMFVALLYAVLNAQDQILTLCSAGQTQPVHMSAATGKAALVETRGDTFPLGILDDSEYEETQLKLEPGDKVVLYTDGIVEAMNAQEEIFGFERLLEVVQTSQSPTAESLLKEILKKVNEFVGEADQHDDLTVIVVSVES